MPAEFSHSHYQSHLSDFQPVQSMCLFLHNVWAAHGMQSSERTVESVLKIHRMMKVLADEIRKDVKVLADPEARRIFESAVSSMDSVLKALLDFEQQNAPDPRAPEL